MELTEEQIKAAKTWHSLHKYHINRITKNVKLGYPPTQEEDKNNPVLWKPEHWFWLLKLRRDEFLQSEKVRGENFLTRLANFKSYLDKRYKFRTA